MSWQRILRFAKMRQVPVVITDETGEDPMILLSLDQLEQALDGGVDPDIPPPSPVPRPTTPAFVPEETADSPAIQPEPEQEAYIVAAEVSSDKPEQAEAFNNITVMAPPIADEQDVVKAVEEGVVVPDQQMPEEARDVMVASSPVEPATTLPEAVEAQDTPPSEQLKPTPPNEMSMEERFFLEY